MKTLTLLWLIIGSFLVIPGDCTIKQDTWAAFNEDDFDKMIRYSIEKE